MKLTLTDINTYKEIVNKIDTLVQAYSDEFIKCNDTYELNRWEINDDNTIRIIYSRIDYLGETCNDDTTITLDMLNGDMELIENYDNVFYRGELKNITDFYKTYCDRCGSQRCDRSEEWMDACPHYKEWKGM